MSKTSREDADDQWVEKKSTTNTMQIPLKRDSWMSDERDILAGQQRQVSKKQKEREQQEAEREERRKIK
jgi:hypothetical protein